MASFRRLWPALNFRWGEEVRAVRVCGREQRLMVPECFYAMDGSRTLCTAYDSPASKDTKAVWLPDDAMMMPWWCHDDAMMMPWWWRWCHDDAECANMFFVVLFRLLSLAQVWGLDAFPIFPPGQGAYEREMVKSYTGYRCRPWCLGVAAALLLLPLWHLTSLDITWHHLTISDVFRRFPSLTLSVVEICWSWF